MDFHLLGPFQARDRGQLISVGNRRQERLLLAILLLDAGRILTIDRLVDLLWNGDGPAGARGVIHTYVGRLRRALAPFGVTIARRGDGYLVDPVGHTVDAVEFVDRAQAAAALLDQGERVRLLEAALGMWRGPLLSDLTDDEQRYRLGGRLAEVRLSTCEALGETRLAMGQHGRVIATLTELADEHPTRERLIGLLMTALYRDRRAAEAIERYRDTCKVLAGDLGVEPGPELQALDIRIRRNDPGLDRPPMPPYAVQVRDQWLPWKAAGHPALEYCNTYAGWNSPPVPGAEWLRSYTTLAVWAAYLDLADNPTVTRLVEEGRHEPRQADAVLAEARTLRTHLYACLTQPDAPASFEVVAGYAEAAAQQSRFTRDDSGLGRWYLAESAGLRLPLYAAARCAAELLADPRLHTVRRCPAADCGWLYLDPSGLRQWCTMGLCAPPDRRHPDAQRALCA